MTRFLVTVLALGCFAQAQAPSKYHAGKLLQMESVQCVVSETQQATVRARAVNCEEYVLEGEGVLFHLRSPNLKHATELPVGHVVRYRIEEGHFFLRSGKKDQEFVVVSMEPRESKAAPVRSARVNHLQ